MPFRRRLTASDERGRYGYLHGTGDIYDFLPFYRELMATAYQTERKQE
jgi:hypothetical protein